MRRPSPGGASIQPNGVFLQECGLEGERRSDDVFPAHPNGAQLSRDRFLILYATRGWRGIDEDRSIVYQVRAGSYLGPVLKEGMLAATLPDWNPGDGGAYFQTNGAPSVFGVPKGARIRGVVPAHANLFVAKWYRNARAYREDGTLYKGIETHELMRRTLHVPAVQFRLNDTDDDIEVLQPATELRQVGYETGPYRCSVEDPGDINHGLVNPVPLTGAADEWLDTCQFGWSEPGHFGGNRVAAVRHRYNRERHRYEWVETGPLLFYPHFPAIEASPIRWRGGFVIAARSYPGNQGANFLRLDDPFAPAAAAAGASTVQLPAAGPATAYGCPDGVVRFFSGIRQNRNPLYCTTVDPDDGFAVRGRSTVIDLLASGLPLRPEARPVADMAPRGRPHRPGAAPGAHRRDQLPRQHADRRQRRGEGDPRRPCRADQVRGGLSRRLGLRVRLGAEPQSPPARGCTWLTSRTAPRAALVVSAA